MRRALLLGLALSVWGAWERSGAAQQWDSTPRPLPRQRFWVRPAASLLLPGAGQFLAHQERGAIYVAAEVYSLARIIQLSRRGRSEGERFRALAFYLAHAVGPAFLWSWRDAEPQHATFRETIKRSDDAFRGAQNLLGVVLANHVVSVVDALISTRLSAAAGRRAEFQTTVGPRTVVRLCLEF